MLEAYLYFAPSAEQGVRQLHAQPIILAEPPEPAPISRLFVIWDDWPDLSVQERSEIILNAYIGARGHEAGLQVSVAMGLTSAEAMRMNLL